MKNCPWKWRWRDGRLHAARNAAPKPRDLRPLVPMAAALHRQKKNPAPRRQREHDVEVRDGQQFGLALLQPCARLRPLALGAMPIATANGRRPLAALWADPVMG